VWCHEKGTLVDGEGYEFDYVMRYEFDGQGRLEKLVDYTDSVLQKGIYERWMARLEGEKKTKVKIGGKWEGERKQKEDARKEKGRHDSCFFLITSPRTASNLLLRILALDKQPNVMTVRNGGYFFLRHVFLMSQLKL
jgi:hypothetical protein